MSEEAINSTEVNVDVDLAPEAHEDGGHLSFDELDNLTDGRSEEGLLSEQSKKESAPKEDKQQAKREDHDEEADLGSEAEEGEAEAYQEEIKKILARAGEQEMELAANTLFKHKVDGEDVDVDLQELLNNYSGKVSYDKKFQEFSDTKKQFETQQIQYNSEIEAINKYINGFADKMKNNDASGALEYFAEFAGMKPYEFRRELLRQLTPEMERIGTMSPEELRAEELSAQNTYLQQQQESAQQRIEQEQAVKELQQEIVSVQEALGISDSDFREAYNDLAESDFEGEITPAIVGDYYRNLHAFSKAENILSEVDPVLGNDDGIVETLQNVILENPNFDNDDLMEIVQDVYGSVKKEASKSVSKKVSPKKQEQKAVPSKQDYTDWDDL